MKQVLFISKTISQSVSWAATATIALISILASLSYPSHAEGAGTTDKTDAILFLSAHKQSYFILPSLNISLLSENSASGRVLQEAAREYMSLKKYNWPVESYRGKARILRQSFNRFQKNLTKQRSPLHYLDYPMEYTSLFTFQKSQYASSRSEYIQKLGQVLTNLEMGPHSPSSVSGFSSFIHSQIALFKGNYEESYRMIEDAVSEAPHLLHSGDIYLQRISLALLTQNLLKAEALANALPANTILPFYINYMFGEAYYIYENIDQSLAWIKKGRDAYSAEGCRIEPRFTYFLQTSGQSNLLLGHDSPLVNPFASFKDSLAFHRIPRMPSEHVSLFKKGMAVAAITFDDSGTAACVQSAFDPSVSHLSQYINFAAKRSLLATERALSPQPWTYGFTLRYELRPR
ncbi:hypothetical protein QGN29_00340 [Temperatibacter marinus]|uniref:Uncharacterized protein n=1 Tax=Temperatibacter marinus TaxID=1456591 RepID=A0AA52HAJ6_9PROT|nr:hypothetical protein [Temperatibacter marinus]WND02810.1 hypothetical protein QGN29_00340 [Temperatibacter marinus]